jgi:hypothetical protein
MLGPAKSRRLDAPIAVSLVMACLRAVRSLGRPAVPESPTSHQHDGGGAAWHRPKYRFARKCLRRANLSDRPGTPAPGLGSTVSPFRHEADWDRQHLVRGQHLGAQFGA